MTCPRARMKQDSNTRLTPKPLGLPAELLPSVMWLAFRGSVLVPSTPRKRKPAPASLALPVRPRSATADASNFTDRQQPTRPPDDLDGSRQRQDHSVIVSARRQK